MPDIPLDRQIAAVRDEISKRRRLYPRWVDAGRMKEDESQDRIAAMEAVLATLKQLKDERAAKVQPALF